jgi:threonine/homoserine/homoserine lactone efflux protein
MPTSTTLASFTLATALLLVLPGPAVLFVVTRSATLGLRRGLLGTLGVECGSLVHVGAAAAGVSAVLTRSDVAFALVKYAGAAYLCLLGVRQLRGAGTGHAGADGGSASSRAFADGFVVEALNPKTALFFIAFLPQFVDPARGAGRRRGPGAADRADPDLGHHRSPPRLTQPHPRWGVRPRCGPLRRAWRGRCARRRSCG